MLLISSWIILVVRPQITPVQKWAVPEWAGLKVPRQFIFIAQPYYCILQIPDKAARAMPGTAAA